MRTLRCQLGALALVALALGWAGAAAAAPAANIDQIRNGAADSPIDPPDWTNGNAGAQNSHFVEGYSIGYRCVMTDLPTDGSQVRLILEFDAKHSDRHAIDYLTYYQRLGGALHLDAFGHPAETIQPLMDIAGFTVGDSPSDQALIPVPTSLNSPTAGMPQDSYYALPGDEVQMSLWGGEFQTWPGDPGEVFYLGEADLSLAQSAQQIVVTFVPSGPTAVLAWGGHIASRYDWGTDADGVPLSAGGISGSPYHMRLIDWNLTNLGNQDLSLSVEAVYTPPPICDVYPGDETICEGSSATFTDNTTSGVPPYTYAWTLGGMGSVLSTTNTLTISDALPADSGEYWLIVTDAVGKADTCYADLEVVPTPDVEAGVGGTITCDDPTITLSGSSSTPGATFLWTTGDGHIVSGANTLTPTVDAAGTYTLTVTEPIAYCTNSDDVTVLQDTTVPTVEAGTGATLTCDMPTYQLSGSTDARDPEIEWTTTDGHIVSGANTLTPTVDAAGTYTLRVKDLVNGCEDTDTVVIESDQEAPMVDAGTGTTLTCDMPTYQLGGSTDARDPEIEWTTSDGHIVSGANTLTPTVDAAGTYTLRVKDLVNGCEASDTVVMQLDQQVPMVDAGTGATLTCDMPTYQLSGSTDARDPEIEWTTSDGNIVSGANTLTPTVDAAGTYTLRVKDLVNGCEDTDTVDMELDQDVPMVDAGTGTTLTCDMPTYQLSGSTDARDPEIEWTTTDGHIVSGANTLTPTVDAAGTYTLRVKDLVNGCEDTDTVDMELDQDVPMVDAGTGTTLTCDMPTYQLGGSTDAVDPQIEWTTSDGNIVSGANTLTPTVDAAGTYTLHVVDLSNGCEASDTVVMQLDQQVPMVDAGTGTTLTCDMPTYQLGGSTDARDPEIEWTTSDGNIVSGANTLTPTVDAAGTYTLRVKDLVNGCEDTDTVVMQLDQQVPMVDAGTGTILTCDMPTYQLSGSTDARDPEIEWTTSDGHIVSGANTLTPTVDAAGTYTLRVKDLVNGCEDTDTVEMQIDQNVPTVDAGTGTTLTCDLPSYQLSGSTDAVDPQIEWTTTDGNIVSGANTLTPTVDAAGTYTLHVVDLSNGCEASDTVVMQLDQRTPQATAGGDTTLTCLVLEIELTGTTDAVTPQIEWTTADGHIVSGANTLTPTVDAAGTYTLRVKDLSNGCQVTDDVIIEDDFEAPDVSAGADSTLTCLVEEIVLAGGSSTDGVTYLWTTEDGNIVSGEDTATPTIDAYGRYILTVTDPGNGCTAADTVDIDQDIEPPSCSLACPETPVACGSEGNVMTSDAMDAVAYAWTLTGDGWSITGGEDTDAITYTAGTGDGIFKLVVTAANGCVDSCTVTCPCAAGETYCSYTQGGWGNTCPDSQADDMLSTQPGCIRDHYFDEVFPDGVSIGLADGGYHATWTSAAAVRNFLPAGKKPAALTSDYTNPLETSAGVLAGQILALKLNVAYSGAGVFVTVGLQEEVSPYANYVIPDSCGMFAGMTVGDFLALADSVVGGRTDLASPSAVNMTATCLNEAFDNCQPPEPEDRSFDDSAMQLNSGVPTQFTLDQNRPNPFNPTCEIRYGLPRESRVRIVVYNLLGQRVRTLVDAVEAAGYRTVLWNGTDDGGRRVTSGIYIYRLETSERTVAKKMVLLK